MKIILVSINPVTTPYPVYPIGLEYVAGALKNSHDVEILDMHNYQTHEELADDIAARKPEIIGLSIRNIDNTDGGSSQSYTAHYRKIIEAIRARVSAPVVIGGSGFTIFPHEMMADLEADYGVIGEGERFSLLADRIASGQSADDIPGILTGRARREYPEPWQGVIRRRVMPDGVRDSLYIKKGGMLNIQTKRGCTFTCIYCSYPLIEGKTMRFFDPDEVAETAIKLEEAGARYLFITDSAFNTDIGHSLDVARAFAKAGLSIPWGAFFAPIGNLPPDYFSVMKESGCAHVEFGTESLSNRVLKRYSKSFTVEDVFRAHAMARQSELHIAHYLLAGGPGENHSTLNETLDNAEKLDRAAVFFYTGMRIYPGTGLYTIALKEGQITEDDNLLEPVFYQSPEISVEEIIALVKERGQGRSNWVIGSLDDRMTDIMSRLYRRGRTGPLWENLAR